MTRVMAQERSLCYTEAYPTPGGVGERKELIAVKENVLIAVVSVLVGLFVGYLAWGASTAWGSAQPSSMSSPMMGPGMMNGMMGGMMGQGMMNQPSQSQNMMGSEHMAQCHQMMGSMMAMMQQHMQAAPPSSNENQ